jgi:predicted ester cyclase
MSASENKEIVRRYWEGRFNEKDYDVVDEFFPSTDIEGQKAWLDRYHAAWADVRVTLDHLIAEDELVVVHCTFEATHVGEWEGFAASGERVTDHGMALCRVVDGKIVEDHVFYGDGLEVLLAQDNAGQWEGRLADVCVRE